MANWVNGAIKEMQQDDFFWTAFQRAVTDQAVQQQFERFVPRPANTLSYPTGSIFEC